MPSEHREHSPLQDVRVLVVDGDGSVCRELALWLEADGARARGVTTIADAERCLAASSWDAVVFKRLLPDGDAFSSLLPRAAVHWGLAVVARAPFSLDTYRLVESVGAALLAEDWALDRQLLSAAMTVALHRRHGSMRVAECGELVRFGKFVIDRDAWTLTDDTTTLTLRQWEVEVLARLAVRAGEWTSVSDLAQHGLQRYKPTAPDSADSVRQYIYRLRPRIAKVGLRIERRWGRGYRLAEN